MRHADCDGLTRTSSKTFDICKAREPGINKNLANAGPYGIVCDPRVQLVACKRESNRAADVGCHAPPRGVRMTLVQLRGDCALNSNATRLTPTDQPSTTASSCRGSSASDPCGETRQATRCTLISHLRPLTGYSRLTSEKIPLSN
jgi:hypothetical protein